MGRRIEGSRRVRRARRPDPVSALPPSEPLLSQPIEVGGSAPAQPDHQLPDGAKSGDGLRADHAGVRPLSRGPRRRRGGGRLHRVLLRSRGWQGAPISDGHPRRLRRGATQRTGRADPPPRGAPWRRAQPRRPDRPDGRQRRPMRRALGRAVRRRRRGGPRTAHRRRHPRPDPVLRRGSGSLSRRRSRRPHAPRGARIPHPSVHVSPDEPPR